jgi:hypothetical protein
MTKLTASLGLSALMTTFTLAAGSQPQPDPGMPRVDPSSPSGIFGERGQLAIMGEAGALFTHTSVSGQDGSTTTIVVRPAIDYFVIDHLSIGAFTGVQYSGTPTGSTTTYGIGPRVGYDIPFTDRFSVWPKAGLSFNSTTVKFDSTPITPSTSESNTAMALDLYVPLMFHSHHYFVGFGPSLDTDLTGDTKVTTIAARLVVGGWLF